MSTFAKLNTGEICCIERSHEDGGEQCPIRILTPLFDDYKFATVPSSELRPILRITSSDIHNLGLSTLVHINKFKIILQEPILVPFAPRINDNTHADTVADILEWWRQIKQISNAKKLKIFMALSYHSQGPIVDTVDRFLTQHRSELTS